MSNETGLTENERAVLEQVRRHTRLGDPVTPDAIHYALPNGSRLSRNKIGSALRSLVAKGVLTKPSRGFYLPVERERMSIEYRVCWSASSNITFKGSTDWAEWDGDEGMSADEVRNALEEPEGGEREVWSTALEMAAEASGFEYRVETREVESEAVDG